MFEAQNHEEKSETSRNHHAKRLTARRISCSRRNPVFEDPRVIEEERLVHEEHHVLEGECHVPVTLFALTEAQPVDDLQLGVPWGKA